MFDPRRSEEELRKFLRRDRKDASISYCVKGLPEVSFLFKYLEIIN